MKRPAIIVLLLLAGYPALCQKVTVLVAPFDSSRTGSPHLGKKVALILNLQIWQTLQKPSTRKGSSSVGKVLWVTFSDPPRSQPEARRLASYIGQDPRLVLWGRAWHFGGGTVVEAFLLIRSNDNDATLLKDFWSVTLSRDNILRVGVPREEVEFAPIVIRTDLLEELENPSGLKLYANRHDDKVKGLLGDAFTALEQDGDAALVKLPNGDAGWVHLPNFSTDRSEVANFAAALTRIFRHDWLGAMALFKKVIDSPQTPVPVRVDAYLYLSFASEKIGKGSYEWAEKAYEVNPYSKTVVQYLCMSLISDFNHLSPIKQQGQQGLALLRSINDILSGGAALFPSNDPWLARAKQFASSRMR